MEIISEADAREGTPAFFALSDRVFERGRWLKQAVLVLAKDARAMIESELLAYQTSTAFVRKVYSVVLDEFKCPDAFVPKSKSKTLVSLVKAIDESAQYRELLLAQLMKTFVEPLEFAAKEDYKEIKIEKQRFDKSKEEFDSFQQKYAALNHPEKKSVQETKLKKELSFQAASVLYRNALVKFHQQQEAMVCERFLLFGKSFMQFFHQSHEGFNDLAAEVQQLSMASQQIRSDMIRGVPPKSDIDLYESLEIDSIMLSCMYRGHLNIMVNSGDKKVNSREWIRYYCVLDDTGKLLIMLERPKGNESLIVETCIMKDSIVRPLNRQYGRSFTFDIRSASSGVFKLQADSEKGMYGWVAALQSAAKGATGRKPVNLDESESAQDRQMRDALRRERERQERQYRDYLTHRNSVIGPAGESRNQSTRELQDSAKLSLRSQESPASYTPPLPASTRRSVISGGVRLMTSSPECPFLPPSPSSQAPPPPTSRPPSRMVSVASKGDDSHPNTPPAIPDRRPRMSSVIEARLDVYARPKQKNVSTFERQGRTLSFNYDEDPTYEELTLEDEPPTPSTLAKSTTVAPHQHPGNSSQFPIGQIDEVDDDAEIEKELDHFVQSETKDDGEDSDDEQSSLYALPWDLDVPIPPPLSPTLFDATLADLGELPPPPELPSPPRARLPGRVRRTSDSDSTLSSDLAAARRRSESTPSKFASQSASEYVEPQVSEPRHLTGVDRKQTGAPSRPHRPSRAALPKIGVHFNAALSAAVKAAGADEVGAIVESVMYSLVSRNCIIDEIPGERIRVRPKGSCTPDEIDLISNYRPAFLAYIRHATPEQLGGGQEQFGQASASSSKPATPTLDSRDRSAPSPSVTSPDMSRPPMPFLPTSKKSSSLTNVKTLSNSDV